MFPAQTSMMPVQIALARFLEQTGFWAIFSNYPYWYLGTTPFRYLTGPVLPIGLVLLHKVLPGFSLFEIFFYLLIVAWLAGALGVFFLVKALVKPEKEDESGKLAAFLAAVLYFFGGLVPFLFRFSDGVYLITFSFLPFVLLFYSHLLKKWTKKSTIVLVIAISFIILLDSLIVPTLLLGMSAMFLAQVGWGRAEEKLKQTLSVLGLTLLVVTFWYTPFYWTTLAFGPSFAGKGLLEVTSQILKLLPTALAIILAVVSAKVFKGKNLLRDFCFYWLFIFGFLSLIRFISDPDFWLDWSAYGLELQMGIAIMIAIIMRKLSLKMKGPTNRLKITVLLISFFFFYFGFFLFIFNKYLLGTLQSDITKTVEYRLGSQLARIIKPGDRVFLSGTTAFWLNAFFDISQVRGGVDQVSVNKEWRKAAWEIREGEKPEESIKWLKTLGVSYLVVHTDESEEFYHDLAFSSKFERTKELEKIFEENGDRIYQVLGVKE